MPPPVPGPYNPIPGPWDPTGRGPWGPFGGPWGPVLGPVFDARVNNELENVVAAQALDLTVMKLLDKASPKLISTTSNPSPMYCVLHPDSPECLDFPTSEPTPAEASDNVDNIDIVVKKKNSPTGREAAETIVLCCRYVAVRDKTNVVLHH